MRGFVRLSQKRAKLDLTAIGYIAVVALVIVELAPFPFLLVAMQVHELFWSIQPIVASASHNVYAGHLDFPRFMALEVGNTWISRLSPSIIGR